MKKMQIISPDGWSDYSHDQRKIHDIFAKQYHSVWCQMVLFSRHQTAHSELGLNLDLLARPKNGTLSDQIIGLSYLKIKYCLFYEIVRLLRAFQQENIFIIHPRAKTIWQWRLRCICHGHMVQLIYANRNRVHSTV